MGSDQRPKTLSLSMRPKRSFTDDDRAIEGLPIRLVIALIVGVFTLGIMLQILGGIDGLETDSEIDVEFPNDAAIDESSANGVTVEVIDEDGNEVTDAHVIAEAGDARMDTALDKHTGASDNTVTFDLDSNGGLELPPDQTTGTVEFHVQPPSDSNWVDDAPNNELLVIDD